VVGGGGLVKSVPSAPNGGKPDAQGAPEAPLIDLRQSKDTPATAPMPSDTVAQPKQ
jgi:hypothetical protein